MHVTAAGLMNHGKPALLPDEKAALGDRFATRQAGSTLPARPDRRHTAAKAMHPVRNDDQDYSGDVLHNMQHVSNRKDGWLKRSLNRFFG